MSNLMLENFHSLPFQAGAFAKLRLSFAVCLP
jgi:hypothetical protein